MEATVAKVFQETARIYGGKEALRVNGEESHRSVTYQDLYRQVREIGTGLQSLGIGPGDKVGIISDNRPEWLACDLSCICIGAADVPRGSDITAQETDYILSHSDAIVAFVEDAKQLEKVQSLRNRLPSIRFLVVMDPLFEGSPDDDVHTLQEVAAMGRRLLEEGDGGFEKALGAVKAADLATIIYTSGTTGEPKGVMLSHRNLMQNIEVLPGWLQLSEEDRWLSILPPWHIFERMAEYMVVGTGATMAYTSIRTLVSDLAAVQPTFMASVPRIWEGIYTKVMAKMAREPAKKRKVFFTLVELSKKYVKARKVLQNLDPLYEEEPAPARAFKRLRALGRVVLTGPLYRIAQKKFAPIRERTGGKLRAAVSGGGALPAYVDEFFAAVGITLLEGYGLTETSPVLAARTFDCQVLGTVGLPIPGTEIKIVGEDGDELARGLKGLVMVRGEQVMEGYYKKPAETAAAIDEEGWFDTGDLGRMTIRGELSLTGRAKETIVLLGGENIEPTPIEDAITESSYISQAMVVGQDRKSLGVLVIPDLEALRERSGLQGMEAAELCRDESVQALVKDEIKRLVSAERGFKAFERITRFRLLENEFAIGEELTHTLKKRRNIISDRYEETIGEMYR